MNGDHGTVTWRPGMFSHDVAHLAIVGQTPRVSARHGRRFVWAVCGVTVQVDSGTDGCTARCSKCLAWFEQHGAPPNDESPGQPEHS